MHMPETCKDLKTLNAADFPAARRTNGCEECLAEGGRWVELRECRDCGHVGCCDSSPGRHATAHFKKTNHPVARSIEPGAEWAWCYVHELEARVPEPALAGGSTRS
jgi:CPA1 family monovalent cation:H+ antiporter